MMNKLLTLASVVVATATTYAQNAADTSMYDQLDEVVVTSGVIDVAKTRETPVAVSTITPAEISVKIGNLEFPEIMSRTPGVYVTRQGGGYGDSRMNLRGFDQRNTSFLINGQPVNDMENGWVYWSNWQGLTDVASGIQIQRGLGASRLAVPSVGGTVSIFTKAAELKKGGSVSQTVGNNGYFKTSAVVNTGKSKSGWASSFLLSRWVGNGYAYGTAGEGWTYFGAVGYAPKGSKHSVNLSFIGAGQWHHQRDAWVSVRDYMNFGTAASDSPVGLTAGDLSDEDIDRRWNTDAGRMTIDGTNQEFSMRRNFYNKPLATFNWDYAINSNWKLNTSVYGSAGRGGGTGPRGGNFRNADLDFFPFNKDLTQQYLVDGRGTRITEGDYKGQVDFDAAVAINQNTTNPYTGGISAFQGQLIGSNGFRDSNVNRAVLIRRASMNSHDWYGVISNLEGKIGKLRTSIGVDLRTYKGYHYRSMNHLMGLDGYYSTGNKNSLGTIVNTTIEATPFNPTGLDAPKIDYFNNGLVGWQGVNGLVEYATTKLTAVVQAGASNQSFQREDFFDQPTNPISEVQNQLGGYVKGGANFNINEHMNVFANAGVISRQPLFDAVFPGFANDINPDLQNEQIRSLELGYGYVNNKLTANVNLYSTTWGNRFITASLLSATGVDGTAQFKDIDVVHNGLEIEATYRASRDLKFQAMVSAGNWEYTKDFTATVFDENNNQVGEGTLYMEGVKVGDAAQFTSALNADYRVGKFNFDLGFRFFDNLYASYNITDNTFKSDDNLGALKLPAYSLVDFGTTARLGEKWSLRVNVNNLLDTKYIAESKTNIHADANSATWNGVDVRNMVWFGFGRTWNASLKYAF